MNEDRLEARVTQLERQMDVILRALRGIRDETDSDTLDRDDINILRAYGASALAVHSLLRADIRRVEQIESLTDRQLMKFRNFGAKSLREIRGAVALYKRGGFLDGDRP